MRLTGIEARRAAPAAYCAALVVLTGAYAVVTMSAIVALPCDRSLDPQRFCVWWQHSAPPTLLGIPAVLGLGCYASLAAGSRRPVTVACVLVALVCHGLSQAAVQEFYGQALPFPFPWASSADS